MTTATDPFAAAGTTEVDDGGVRRDRYGRYLLPDPTGKATKAQPFTRATTFAKSISDTFTLSQWSQRMAIKGVAMRPDLLAKVASTPLSDRDGLNQAAEMAKETAGAKEGANLGTAVHAFTEQVDRGEITADDVPPPWNRDVKAYSALLEAEGVRVVDDMIERIVLCLRFGIAGTFDRLVVATRDLDFRLPSGRVVHIAAGTILVFDLKTGRDLEYGWGEISIQLALYANADHIYVKATDSYTPLPEVHKGIALVLHLPVGKGKATLHAVDIEAGWQAAELCEQVRNWRKMRKLAAPLAVVDLSEPPAQQPELRLTQLTADEIDQAYREEALAARPASTLERVETAQTIPQLEQIRLAALGDRTWTPEVERAALARARAIKADTAAG